MQWSGEFSTPCLIINRIVFCFSFFHFYFSTRQIFLRMNVNQGRSLAYLRPGRGCGGNHLKSRCLLLWHLAALSVSESFSSSFQCRCLFFFQSSGGGTGGVTEQWTRKWHFKVIVASARRCGLSLTGVENQKIQKNKTYKNKINSGHNVSTEETRRRGRRDQLQFWGRLTANG